MIYTISTDSNDYNIINKKLLGEIKDMQHAGFSIDVIDIPELMYIQFYINWHKEKTGRFELVEEVPQSFNIIIYGMYIHVMTNSFINVIQIKYSMQGGEKNYEPEEIPVEPNQIVKRFPNAHLEVDLKINNFLKENNTYSIESIIEINCGTDLLVTFKKI